MFMLFPQNRFFYRKVSKQDLFLLILFMLPFMSLMWMHLDFKILDNPKLYSSGISIMASCSIFQLLSVPGLPELHPSKPQCQIHGFIILLPFADF